MADQYHNSLVRVRPAGCTAIAMCCTHPHAVGTAFRPSPVSKSPSRVPKKIQSDEQRRYNAGFPAVHRAVVHLLLDLLRNRSEGNSKTLEKKPRKLVLQPRTVLLSISCSTCSAIARSGSDTAGMSGVAALRHCSSCTTQQGGRWKQVRMWATEGQRSAGQQLHTCTLCRAGAVQALLSAQANQQNPRKLPTQKLA